MRPQSATGVTCGSKQLAFTLTGTSPAGNPFFRLKQWLRFQLAMKTYLDNLIARHGGASFVAWVIIVLLAAVHQAAAQPIVSFTQPTNGQQIVTFSSLAGTARTDTGTVQEVVFSIYDQSAGQWWNGINYQWAPVALPATLSGTNWTPAPGIALPVPCCGRYYQLGATATDSETNTTTTNITVQADSVAPAVTFSPLTDGQTVTDLLAIGGSVADNFNLVASVVFSIHELDINGGSGRWWNGTNFQSDPIILPATVSGTNWSPLPGLALPALNSGQSYVLTATATDSNSNAASTNITVQAPITDLAWDPGETALGTVVLTNPNTNGGNYWFRIIPQSPSVGVWRTALNVLPGEANVYLRYSFPPNIYSYHYASQRVGSDGFVLDSSQFSPSQDWYILVTASTNARWNLVTGDAFVYDLGTLAADSSRGTNAPIGAEGMIFYMTTISSDTLAWRLWLNGASNMMYVKKSAAPHPASYGLIQAGQMLVVPPFLAGGTFNGSYFIGVSGDPGTVIALDSRKHTVTDLPFNSLTNVVVATNEYPYRTFRVQVPVQQIAWQLNLSPTNGLPNIAVRRDLVPNEFRNDAFSETPTNVGASVTLVPPPPGSGPGTPGLSDGTFFVTIYSTSSYSCGFNNANPVITDVHYLFAITNDAPTRAGWRYYRVANIAEQLGTLGWELLLANQVPGTEIALRRNAVPGRWNRRDNDNNYGSGVQGHVDFSGTGGFLQRPGHQADIWYIGIYTPDHALGSFVLTGDELTSQLTSFDGAGSTVNITNQLVGQWRFFRVDVPTNAVGWDVRLVTVTSGRPQMMVRRDQLPANSGWNWPESSSWSSGRQWQAGQDWTRWSYSADGTNEDGRILAMGMGRPLEAGTYYIGVINAEYDASPLSYTLVSRGIGEGMSLPVVDLAYAGGSVTNELAVREAAYYRVDVPSNTPGWKVKLSATTGEAMVAVLKGTPPNVGCDLATYNGWGWWVPRSVINENSAGKKLQKAGNEHLVLLPENGQSNLVAGTYYLAVVSEGINPNPDQNRIGAGSSSYVLESLGALPVVQMGTVGTNDLVQARTLEAGETAAYQFEVPVNTAAIEVRLEDRVGNPVEMLAPGPLLSAPQGSSDYHIFYGIDGGVSGSRDFSLLTVANPTSGTYSLTVQATHNNGTFANASYTLRVRKPVIPLLNICSQLNTNGQTNIVSGVLADNQRAFYQVAVPAAVAGAPLLGWKLDLTSLNGTPSVRVRKNLLPEDNAAGTSPFNALSATIAPPYLTPGTWYVEVRGGGSTEYSLTSSTITTNALDHALWVMPVPGQTNVAPGLTLPMIGDSGIDAAGNPLPADQGIDLEQGYFDYYAVLVPANNAGLLRTELQAISGNPNLYLRVGAASTLSHDSNGNGGGIYDRSLTGTTTEYGNWVPLNDRYESQLTPGVWVLAVHAAGNANVRYRLQLSCGNPVTNGVVQDLALNGSTVTNQNLNGGNWRYYRVQIPDPAPANWDVTWTRSLGSARMFVRDTVPPGDGSHTGDYSDPNYNPPSGAPWWWWSSPDLMTWSSDAKNQGPYPRFDAPGIANLTTPPLRPGHTYYLGFWSAVDTTFSVSSSTSGGPVEVTNTIAFYGSSITNVIPGHGSMLFRMDVPPEATRILFNASNSANVVLALEQGTMAQPGGPAHWTSYLYNNSQNPNQANVSLNQPLTTPNNWPWLPGCSYYLAVTNTSPDPEDFGVSMAIPADLVPIEFLAPSTVTSTRPNPQIEVVWGVTNQGVASASGDWWDRVWFSTNGMLDANSVNIGNFWMGGGVTVPPGGTYWRTNSVTLPMSGSGNFWLFVQVDGFQSIYEASVANKVAGPQAGTFTLTPPDLMPVSVVAPATVTATWPNLTIPIAWCVTNQGTGSASGGWYDRIWFSTNGLLDGQSLNLGDFYINPTMPPGGNYCQSNSVTLPMNASGSYTLFVQADIYNWLFESNKANNVSAPLPGTLTLGFAPQFLTQPASQIVTQGSTATFSVVVTGTPPISCQWFSNATNLPGATNTSLVISNILPVASLYWVVASNAYGASTSAVAYLLVTTTTCISAPAGLVAWWPGESNALDVVRGNNGVLVNGVEFTNALVGLGFAFSGGTDYLQLPPDMFPFPTSGSSNTPFSFELWFKTSAGGVILGQQNTVPFNSPGGWVPALYVGTEGRLYAQMFWKGFADQIVSVIAVNDGAFHHLGVTYDGTNEVVYLDGATIGSKPHSQQAYNADYQYQLGTGFTSGWPAGNGGWYPFHGIIDEPALYNRALTPDEITAICLSGSNGKCAITLPPVISQPSLSDNGQFQFVVNGRAGLNYTVLVSTNLSDWGVVYITNAPADAFTIQLGPTTNSCSFYRLLPGP
jgi:hypothetical protein